MKTQSMIQAIMKHSTRGMTLIELMVVLAISSTILGTGIAGYRSFRVTATQRSFVQGMDNMLKEANGRARNTKGPVRIVCDKYTPVAGQTPSDTPTDGCGTLTANDSTGSLRFRWEALPVLGQWNTMTPWPVCLGTGTSKQSGCLVSSVGEWVELPNGITVSPKFTDNTLCYLGVTDTREPGVLMSSAAASRCVPAAGASATQEYVPLKKSNLADFQSHAGNMTSLWMVRQNQVNPPSYVFEIDSNNGSTTMIDCYSPNAPKNPSSGTVGSASYIPAQMCFKAL